MWRAVSKLPEFTILGSYTYLHTQSFILQYSHSLCTVFAFLGILDLSTINIWIYEEGTLYNRIISAK